MCLNDKPYTTFDCNAAPFQLHHQRDNVSLLRYDIQVLVVPLRIFLGEFNGKAISSEFTNAILISLNVEYHG